MTDAKVELVGRLKQRIAEHREHLANLEAEYGVGVKERHVGLVVNFGDMIDLVAALEQSDAVMGEAIFAREDATRGVIQRVLDKYPFVNIPPSAVTEIAQAVVRESTPIAPVQDDDAEWLRKFTQHLGRALPLIDRDRERLEAIVSRLSRQAGGVPEATLGVGDGSGQLFVHGSYEAIKRVQSMIFELERLRAK